MAGQSPEGLGRILSYALRYLVEALRGFGTSLKTQSVRTEVDSANDLIVQGHLHRTGFTAGWLLQLLFEPVHVTPLVTYYTVFGTQRRFSALSLSLSSSLFASFRTIATG